MVGVSGRVKIRVRIGLGLWLGLGFGLELGLVTSWEYGGGKNLPGATNFPRHRPRNSITLLISLSISWYAIETRARAHGTLESPRLMSVRQFSSFLLAAVE